MKEIALISGNTAEILGLEMLIKQASDTLSRHAGAEEEKEEMVVRRFRDFAAFIDDTPDMYELYFISSFTFLNYNFFFAPRASRTVVLARDGVESLKFTSRGIRLLSLEQDEAELVRKLVRILRGGKQMEQTDNEGPDLLSAREREVLVLLCKGYINKEIADKLCISLTTVITHRKNITEKLGIKSLGGLTIYAVMNGYIEADSI
ncbi:MAG: response regulator transcription factor [Bacteroidaceae bacterium]|jgi:DNA-binding CsgD family transcriptional regulator